MIRKNIIKVPCTRSFQNGKEVYNLFLSPEILDHILIVDQMEINNSDHASVEGYSGYRLMTKEDGYQRSRDNKDIKAVASHIIKSDSFLPNGVWLNDRDKISWFEKRGKEENGISLGFFCFHRKGSRFFCPDGQTRIKGIIVAWKEMSIGENGDNPLSLFALPCVITKVSKDDEAKGFLQINDNGTKVETIHKAAIRFQSILTGSYSDLSRKERMQAIGYGVMERVNSQGGSLDDMILFDKKEKYKQRQIKTDSTKINKRKIKAGSFLNSLTDTGVIPFMLNFYKGVDVEIQIINISKDLDRFWNATYKYTKPMWEDSDQYAFLSAIGTRSMNTLFLYLMRLITEKDRKVEITEDLFKSYLLKSKLLKDSKKWLVTKGVEAQGLLKDEIIHTMADKRGTSYGTVVAKDIFDEICKKEGKDSSIHIGVKNRSTVTHYPPSQIIVRKNNNRPVKK